MTENRTIGNSWATKWISNQKRTDLLPVEALREAYTPQLQDALETLAEIAGKLNAVEMVTATNHNTERDKWLEAALKGKIGTPDLRYNHELLEQVRRNKPILDGKIKPMFAALSRELATNPVGEALMRLAQLRLTGVDMLVQMADAILSGNAERASTAMLWCYGLPETEVVEAAKVAIEDRKAGRLIQGKPAMLSAAEQEHLEATKLDAEAIRRVFLWAAGEYGFAETRPVVVSDRAAAIDVRDVSSEGPIVVIPADQETSGLRIAPLTVHEVGAHWRDSENMKQILPLMGGGALKPIDELLYEGHAVWQERQVKLASQGFIKETRSLYYVVAIDYAFRRKASFAGTAKMLYETVRCDGEPAEATLKDVWRVVYRTYRGNPRMDRQIGYVFSKDQAYYAGRLLAGSLSEAGLGYLLDYSTLTVRDLNILTERFSLRPQGGSMPHPAQDDMAMRLYTKVLNGEFSV